MTERDWWPLINKRAAIKEHFPKYAAVLAERPGTPRDRELKAFYYAENRLSMLRSYVSHEDRVRFEQEQAAVFIDLMREKKREEFRAKFRGQTQMAQPNEDAA